MDLNITSLFFGYYISCLKSSDKLTFFNHALFVGTQGKMKKPVGGNNLKCSSFVCASSIFLLLHNAAFAQDFIK